MAWWYNNRKKLKEGRPWIDDNGVKHRYNWIKWSDLTKKIHGLTWEAENVRPIKINTPEVNPTMILQLAEFIFDLSSFNLDASINLKVIIDNINPDSWEADIDKIVTFTNDAIIGPITISDNMGGTLTINNSGTITGTAGIGNGGDGGHAITMHSNTTINNTGIISGGGGAGGNGGNGGRGGNSIKKNINGDIITVKNISGGMGGAGGSSEGIGAGYKVFASSGELGENGGLGLNNAGTGGAGGIKGNGGELGKAGLHGISGNRGANGNATSGVLGAPGSPGGAAGKAIHVVAGILTYNDNGTTNGTTN
tara:strand:- start:186 stop:1112 length:927 start_codon:yes stop_codon:yes gene_type:complete